MQGSEHRTNTLKDTVGYWPFSAQVLLMPISATMNSGFRSGESSCPSPPLAFGRMRYKTGVVVEQPEVGDGIAHEQELDVFQIF